MNLSLEELIYQVKRELLEAQKKHEREPAYLELSSLELEVSLIVNKKANGKVSLYVAQLGADVSEEQIQKVKLAFNVIDLLPDAPLPQGGGNTSKAKNRPSKEVKRGGNVFR